MVKHTVFNAVHRKANHVVPFGGDCKDFILPQT
jgi:hypothetical protein